MTLPETAAVHWRPRMDAGRLTLYARAWTATTVFQVAPMVATAALLFTLHPVAAVVGAILLAHAWAIPELYANRGAKALKPRPSGDAGAQATALGLLGDLLDQRARELQTRTGLVVERGRLGVWVLGEAGAVLVRGRRAHCWCVRAADRGLPGADRIAHLLLALREDEQGFATVANHAFAGARWRVRRRLPKRQRAAFDAAVRLDRMDRRGP